MKRILKLQKTPDKVFKSEDGEMVTLPGQNIPEPVFNTINELVCAVNEMQREIETINCAMLDLATPDGDNSALKALSKNQTQNALDIAINILKQIDNTRSVATQIIATRDRTLTPGNVFCWTTPDEIHNALEQINRILMEK